MAAIGLKTHIWNNNLRSILLLATYPLLIAGLAWAIGFAIHYSFLPELATSAGFATNGLEGAAKASALRNDRAIDFANSLIVAYWPTILTIVAIWFTIAYFFQTKMVRALSHAHPVTREQEPELYNLLENLAISRGLKMPQLEIIETHARNAFASGVDERSYTVTVTRGLLQSLQKDEIEAVLAHELTHIINRDVRLLIISVIFTGMIGFFAQLAWSSIRFNLYAGMGRRRDGRAVIVLLVVAAILWLGYLATMFTRFALSRRREYMADAGAVELTKNPEAMMRALMRLAGKDKIPEATDDIALMCIENSRKFFGLFTTHPPLEERVAAISKTTGTPVPEIHPGRRADDNARFKSPEDNRYPWLTAARRGRPSPWDR